MGQGPEVAATTDMRRLLRAVRPVAMLGGFVVMWWLLATGAAQADANSQHSTTNRVLTETVDRVAHQPAGRGADRAAHRARAHTPAPAKVVRAVRHHTTAVLSTTGSTVRNTPAKPIVTAASGTVRSGVTKAVEQTRAVLRTAPIAGSVMPDLDDATDPIDGLPLIGESSTLQGETAATGVLDMTTLMGASAGPATPLAAAYPAALAGHGETTPSSPAGGGPEGPALQPGATAASSAQPGSGTGGGAAVCETGLDIMLLATKTSLSSLAGWHPAGPAYPPAATPD